MCGAPPRLSRIIGHSVSAALSFWRPAPYGRARSLPLLLFADSRQVSNGVDLADTWLMLREKDDDAADDGARLRRPRATPTPTRHPLWFRCGRRQAQAPKTDPPPPADNPEYGVVSEDPLKVLNRFLEPLESCQWSKAIYPPPASFIVDDAAAAAMTALGSAATREDGSAAPASALLGSAPGATHPLESLVGMKLFSASTKWRQNKSFGRMSRGEDDFDEFRETDGDAEGIVTSPVGLLRRAGLVVPHALAACERQERRG